MTRGEQIDKNVSYGEKVNELIEKFKAKKISTNRFIDLLVDELYDAEKVHAILLELGITEQ